MVKIIRRYHKIGYIPCMPFCSDDHLRFFCTTMPIILAGLYSLQSSFFALKNTMWAIFEVPLTNISVYCDTQPLMKTDVHGCKHLYSPDIILVVGNSRSRAHPINAIGLDANPNPNHHRHTKCAWPTIFCIYLINFEFTYHLSLFCFCFLAECTALRSAYGMSCPSCSLSVVCSVVAPRQLELFGNIFAPRLIAQKLVCINFGQKFEGVLGYRAS